METRGEPDEVRKLMHDARNYLNVVVTANRCLARYEELPASYQRFVESISESSDRLREVLDRLHEELRARSTHGPGDSGA